VVGGDFRETTSDYEGQTAWVLGLRKVRCGAIGKLNGVVLSTPASPDYQNKGDKMKITNRERQLPARSKCTDVICPACNIECIGEVAVGQLDIHCNYCGHNWRVDTKGKPIF